MNNLLHVKKVTAKGSLIKCTGISIPVYTRTNLLDSPLKRGDKGVCKFSATHPQPLFLEGSLKVAAYGNLI